MIRQSCLFRSAMFGLGVIAVLAATSRAQPPPKAGSLPNDVSVQTGVEVQTRGPIHEAFAALAIRGPRSSPVISTPPPELIEELIPEQRPEGDNSQWIPGYWAWNDDSDAFLWVSGTYRIVPPGRHWVPGYFNRTEDGWQWIAGFWDDVKNDIDLLPAPPDPVDEAIPPPPAEASIYQPGCWVYHGGQYMWRSGFYLPYREDWLWTPASYYWTPGGYIFNEGYWDYPWQRRGLLFAPVMFSNRLGLQSGWSYRPSYLVNSNFLMASLFERPSYQHYYFGDYYDPRYDRMGFVSWTDARYSANVGNPLFTYYQLQNRTNLNWSRDLRQLYTTRRLDISARPPRTLVQQQTVIQKIHNKTVITNNVTNIDNMTAVAHLTSVDKTRVKLQPITKVQIAEAQKTAVQFREFGAQRAKLEVEARVKAQAQVQPGKTPMPIKVELPAKRPAPVKVNNGPKSFVPPARPVMPEPKPIKLGKGKPAEAGKPAVTLPDIKPKDPVSPPPKDPSPAAKPPAKPTPPVKPPVGPAPGKPSVPPKPDKK